MRNTILQSVPCQLRPTRVVSRIVLLLLLLALQSLAQATPALIAQQISAGGQSRHACAIVNGGAQCWGYNYDGQLGDGGFLDRTEPGPVYGLQTGVTAIVVGGYHTCAIVNGGVKCWGRNPDGELGNGGLDDSAIPVAVQGLTSGVIAISAGLYHTCAVVSGGTVRCWGWNSNGQLGNGTINATNTGAPVTVSNIASGATMLASAGYHTCAIVSGGVQCWGYNAYGELANGAIADSHVPVAASGLSSGVIAIASGLFHTCAIISGGTVRCWGGNGNGELGNNTLIATNGSAPVTVSGISSGTTAIAAGGYHTCAVVSGAAKCWGYNMFGQLGIGSLVDSLVPAAVSGMTTGVTSITASLSDSCALVTIAGKIEVKCWGINLDGEVGLGDHVYQTTPVAVSGLASGASALASSAVSLHNCAVVSGAAQCWGDNEAGELGNGSIIDSSIPVAVNGLTAGVTGIATGGYHSCAVVGGAAKCWGNNGNGQLGNGTVTGSTTPITAIASGVTAITAGYAYTCAIVSGGVKCWGANSNGELGNGSISENHSPVSVSGLSATVVTISSGVAHTCAVLQTGKIQCWGYNSNGQLGNGSNTSTLATPPVTVSGISSGATGIVSGGYHTCAIVSGGVQCWGDGLTGQLGNGGLANSYTPVATTGLTSGVTAITAGGGFSCAIVSGAVKCWGAFYTLAGNGEIALYTTPFAMPTLGSGVTALGSSYSSACGIISGAVKCAGTDYFGELGDGRSVYMTTPAFVVQGDRIFYDSLEGY